MTLGTLVYLLLGLFGIFVSVFYLYYGTVAIVGLMILIPLFMLAFLIFMRLRVGVKVDSKNPIAEKEKMDKPARASITMQVENKNRLLPVTKGIAKVEYVNRFTGEKGKTKVRFSVDGGKTRERRIVIPAMNCGNLAITVKKVRIYDYLSIFAWTIGKNFETQNVLILPPLKELHLGKDRWYNETSEDSDRFSLYKKGDDPSEIFDIREFVDGDKIQRIHWKLSSKTSQLMVKEGSLPLAKLVNVFIDLAIPGHKEERKQNSNRLVQGIYSLAMYMIEHAIPLQFIWYDRQPDVIHEEIVEDEEELIWMLQDLFKSDPTEDPEELVNRYTEWGDGKALESAIYLTVADHEDLDNCGLVRDHLEVMDLRGEEIEVQE
ncbi:MAG: DUF58 domain-containing protein [Eubacterium sp.]|nr:DUF58 domain-containing protein [Eubacterium sp.]